MSLLLYLVSASATLFIVRRFVGISRYAATALLLLPLCLTGRAMLTGGVYAPVDLAYHFDPLASLAASHGIERITNPLPSDVTAQFIPWHAALRRVIASGSWPLWNPFELCGNVLAAAAQSAPFHPVTLLALLLPLPDAFGFMAAMTYLLAATGMFLFLRALGARELPSLFGAAAWALSTYVVAFSETAHGNAIALLPLVMLGADAVARRPGLRAAATLTGALVLLTLCGHPETSLHVVAFAAAYVLVMIDRGQLRHSVAAGLASGVAALLLTAFFLLPMIDAVGQTREFRHRQSGGEAVSASWAGVAHVLPLNFVPFAEGTPGVEEVQHSAATQHHWMGTAYAGAMLFAPAAFALIGVRSRQKWFFAAAIVFGLLAGAQAPVVTALLTHLPLFALAVNARMISYAAFGICVLAALGLELALARREALAGAFLASGGAVVIAIVLLSYRSTLTPDFVRANAIRETIPLLLAFIVLRARSERRRAGAGIVGLLLLQRMAEIGGFIPTIDRGAFFPPVGGFERMHSAEPFRIVAQGPLFPPGASTLYGFEDVRGYQAMTFAPMAETFPLWSIPQPVWSNRVDDLGAPMLSMMNVRYAVALPETLPPAGWRSLGHFAGYQLLENARALPRAFVPARVHTGTRDDLVEMRACRDFAADAWVTTPGAAADADNGPGSVTIRAAAGRLALHSSLTFPSWIVISESAWKGWRATLDGTTPLKIHIADHAFLAVYVKAGEHDVDLAYRPRAAANGAIISIATALALAAFAIVRRRSPAPP